jgi:2-haloalkanoic acid dehalogenase type II
MGKPEIWPQALLLDFYGTVVEEDGAVIGAICNQISTTSSSGVSPKEVADHWSNVFGRMCARCFGDAFLTQRELEHESLRLVLQHFESGLDAHVLSYPLFAYWQRPAIFPESSQVLAQLDIPVCVVSNIDEGDLKTALDFHGLSFDAVVTSEACRAYKPRGEMFAQALSMLSLSAEDVLHVGDSLRIDVVGAKALGIPALWINRQARPLPTDGPSPDWAAGNLREMWNFVTQARTRTS